MKSVLLLAALPGAILGQALEGTWQGTLTPVPNREIRIAFKITKDGSAYQGLYYNIEAGRQADASRGCPCEQRDTLDVRGHREQVKRAYVVQPVAHVEQGCGVAAQRRRVAGDVDDRTRTGRRQPRNDLAPRSLSRRVEHDDVGLRRRPDPPRRPRPLQAHRCE